MVETVEPRSLEWLAPRRAYFQNWPDLGDLTIVAVAETDWAGIMALIVADNMEDADNRYALMAWNDDDNNGLDRVVGTTWNTQCWPLIDEFIPRSLWPDMLYAGKRADSIPRMVSEELRALIEDNELGILACTTTDDEDEDEDN